MFRIAAITKSPLPQLDSPSIRELGWAEDSEFYRAYDTVLQAEEHAAKSKPAEGKLVSVRVAGYLFLEFFARSHIFNSMQPSEKLVSWFTSPPQSPQSTQHDVIIDCGTLLRDKFIRQFRTVTLTTPPRSQPSSQSSRPSFDTLEDMIKHSMKSTGKDYKASKEKALARDGYRCVITGILNRTSYKSNPQFWEVDNLRALWLHTVHIFNESTMQGNDPAVEEDNQGRLLNKTHAAAGALAILESFGFSVFTQAFKEVGGVHKVWNLLTLQVDLHDAFDSLELWFEHAEKPHRYRVCTIDGNIEGHIRVNFKGHDRNIDGAPMFVEFNTQHKEAPPPHPILLALHAMCARVAHMSGAAEFFAQIERDKEEIMVLAFDGSSAPLLSNLLSPHAIVHGIA